MRLSQFYTTQHIEQALDSYLSAVPVNWSVSHKLDLYNHAYTAFEAECSQTDKQVAFNYIYGNLRSDWQVFRNAAGPCWSAEKTFHTLTTECIACSRLALLTAANFIESDSNHKVEACLFSMGKIKPTANYPSVYPWMTVSKFLHFFNPRLFPIYDKKFMWEKVANGVFRRDYEEFCQRNGYSPTENTQKFNLQYMLWASEIMNGADEECMTIFSQWFASQVTIPIGSTAALQQINQYDAAAFEIVAIGAAHILHSSR